jgi:predicted nucleic acid-binding protein
VILVDTSVWIEHIRHADGALEALLGAGQVLVHPFVLGELALGHLRSREVILRELRDLPQAAVATRDEVLHLIERRRLFGTGIGYVDVHLLAAARLMGHAVVWTHDQRLLAVAEKLGLAHTPYE